jgi:hypothetical protein
MADLMLRLCELRDEYFNQLNVHQLSAFHDSLDKDKYYTSDYLIQKLDAYTSELYPQEWIDVPSKYTY